LGVADEAVLLQIVLTVFAGAARVDHTAGAGQIADLELFHVATDLDDPADDLMAGDHGENAGEPIVLDLVEIRMTYSAELDIELYVVGTNVTALKFPGSEIGCRGLCSIAFYWYHNSTF
jgi:hypothetical protein